MRTRIWLPVAALLGICILLFVLRPGTRKEHAPLGEPQSSITDQSVSAEQPGLAPTKPSRSADGNGRTTRSASAESTITPFNPNVVGPNLLTNWQAPIEFYGKVVDENSNVVAGAKVSFHWVEIPDEKGNRSTNSESDAEGLFSLRGAHGPSLSVLVSKEGYYSRSGGAQYGPLGAENFSPDPMNPVVFCLHRKGPGAELITSENGARSKVDVRIPRDGTPVWVDILQKQVSPTGQLEIIQNKPPWREATNWSFRLSIPNGGFIENQDEFQFEAPDANYQPTVEYRFAKGETNWTTQVTKQFYVAFGEPRKYGWIRFESNLGQETVFLTYAINPSGSRNLEPAP